MRETFACRELTLDLNRRSAQAILDIANATPQLKPESLTQAENQSLEGSVQLRRATDPDSEIALVCDSIAARVRAGTPPGEIAVLLRVSEPYQSTIVGQLDARGIPVAARPSAGFLEDPVIAAVLDTIRLTADLEDFDRWTRVLTNPLIGFRQLSVSLAFDAARRFGVRNAFVALRDNPPSGQLAFDDFLRHWRAVEAEARSEESDIASLIATIAREFDLLRPVRFQALCRRAGIRAPRRLGLVRWWMPRATCSRWRMCWATDASGPRNSSTASRRSPDCLGIRRRSRRWIAAASA